MLFGILEDEQYIKFNKIKRDIKKEFDNFSKPKRIKLGPRGGVVDKSDKSIAILEEAKSFTIPDSRLIKIYIDAFKNISDDNIVKTTKNINNIFEITNYINQQSSNGVVYIVKLKNSKSKFAKLLIKAAKTEKADPTSYEYYIGMALNSLRYMNVQNFSLVYGRFVCGFNPNIIKDKSELSKRVICDENYKQKTNVLYEYIATESGKVQTLNDFVKNMENTMEDHIELMNIVLMLMISLQYAQDKLEFTHYDLHLENILIVKLNSKYKFEYKYKDNVYNIVLNYYPFIIDFGRSHINPEKVDKIIKESIIDTDKNKTYKDFKEYQDECWENSASEYTLQLKRESDISLYNKIIKNLSMRLRNEKFKKNIIDILDKKYNKKVNDDNIEKEVLNTFYRPENVKNETMISFGITPSKFHKSYDMYRLVRTIYGIIGMKMDNEFWDELDKELSEAYPFYIPFYYVLPKNYESVTGKFNKPIDIANYIYDLTSEYENKLVANKEVRYRQLGGYGKIKNIKKAKK